MRDRGQLLGESLEAIGTASNKHQLVAATGKLASEFLADA